MTASGLGGRVPVHAAVLLVLGAAWGLTQPLSKIAVSTGHGQFGLVFWQLVIGVAAMGLVLVVSGRRLPLRPAALGAYVVVALVGTVIPNSASYVAIAHLPSGVISILLSLVPMLAFPVALALGLERWSLRRLAGLLAGLAGVLVLILPGAGLPARAMLAWVPLALVAPACYAFEGNYVARWGAGGTDPVQVVFGASLAGLLIVTPLMLASGQFIDPRPPWGAPEQALVLSSLIHAVTYVAYVWLVGRAGPIFAVQVGYLVTGFGVVWAMVLLGESYAPGIWAAMALILGGVALVQPRRHETLAATGGIGENAP